MLLNILNLILFVCAIHLALDLFVFFKYRLYEYDKRAHLLNPIKPPDQLNQIYETIKCQFCKVDLPWKTRRSVEGYMVCEHCRITKLQHIAN